MHVRVATLVVIAMLVSGFQKADAANPDSLLRGLFEESSQGTIWIATSGQPSVQYQFADNGIIAFDGIGGVSGHMTRTMVPSAVGSPQIICNFDLNGPYSLKPDGSGLMLFEERVHDGPCFDMEANFWLAVNPAGSQFSAIPNGVSEPSDHGRSITIVQLIRATRQ